MQKVGFILFDGIQAMDLIAPYELLDIWQQSLAQPVLQLLLISKDAQPIANTKL